MVEELNFTGKITEAQMRENIRVIAETIAAAALRSGRRRDDVRIIAASKFQPLESLYMALDCGITILGENRVQEREQKAAAWTRGKAEWHMIGALQRNKARKAIELFDCIESVDSLELAVTIERILNERADAGLNATPYPVMIEVNTSGEESKNGVKSSEAIWLFEEILHRCSRLEVTGLMTIGPLVGGERKTRASFALLRSLACEAGEKLGASLRHLSMGMSGDYEAAIEEGATLVRIGTGIFGARHG
ncbi:MAG: YggS family pyridoxal phosphate-dependent enzyme [Synergistaceae bacterium]|nr:YggS family pyridoxal phosphate-dependent enzyme [Synergistaceae bacterium]